VTQSKTKNFRKQLAKRLFAGEEQGRYVSLREQLKPNCR